MDRPPSPFPRILTGRLAPLLVVAAAFLAYLPALFGEFVYDDGRFIVDNEAIHELTPKSVISFFTDPKTLASVGHEGIYRPLRTLEFAVDWAIAGNSPGFFHLRSLLYHLLGSILVWRILSILLEGADGGGAAPGAATFGAAVFALHPVQTESVAWITSRGDVMLVTWFLLALLLHLKGRRLAAALVFVLALLSKESAVVFPAAVLLVDGYRGAKLRWGWLSAYGAISAAYVLFYFFGIAGGNADQMGHIPHWWGGSYGSNLLTMSKGFLLYAERIFLPVMQVIDYHVPASVRLDLGSALAILILLSIAVLALLAGRRSRFALLWFFVTILPVSNLLVKIGIPTAERFLYLPLFGVALWAGPILARSRLTYAVLVCLFLLTFARSIAWKTDDSLWTSAGAVAATPRGIAHEAARALEKAYEERVWLIRRVPDEGIDHRRLMWEYAEETVKLADELIELYQEEILLPPGKLGGVTLSKKSNALLLLGRTQKALETANIAIRLDGGAAAYYNAAVALERLGRKEESNLYLRKAKELGWKPSK